MKPTIEQIAALFDEIDEDYLTPFDWNPNTKLPNHGHTYRLKDRFRLKYRNYICVYDNIEDCRIAFMGLFYDNIKYVYQCHELIEKIKIVSDPDMYETYAENNSTGYRVNKSNNTVLTSSNNLDYVDSKEGTLGGSGEASTHNSAWNEKFEAIDLKKVLDKKQDAIMQIMDPNMRNISQGYTRDLNISATMGKNMSSTSNSHLGGYKNKNTHITRMRAANELAALTAGIPRLVSQFLECFNPLFYY